MYEFRPGESTVLNWRGPLLAAAIFAAVFSVLLLMAHQNQSIISHMDPAYVRTLTAPACCSILIGGRVPVERRG